MVDKKKRFQHDVREHTWDRVHWRLEEIKKKDPTKATMTLEELLEELILRGLNEKHPQDYMLHSGPIGFETKCFDCGKALHTIDWGIGKIGMWYCQDCYSKRWTGPMIARRELKKKELDNDIKCLQLEKKKEIDELDQVRKERGWADNIASVESVYNEKQRELERLDQVEQEKAKTIEKLDSETEEKTKQLRLPYESWLTVFNEKKEALEKEYSAREQQFRNLNSAVVRIKVQLDWDSFWNMEPADLEKYGDEEQKIFFGKLKAMKTESNSEAEAKAKELYKRFLQRLEGRELVFR